MTAWALSDDGTRTVLTPARGPVRWDIAVTRALAGENAPRVRRRLARQVRQDIWRAVARVPGFVPLVAVGAGPDGLEVTAGGCLLAPTGHRPTIAAAIAAILDNTQNRTRWLAHAVRHTERHTRSVIPAQAGIPPASDEIPACAGMTAIGAECRDA